MWPFISMLFARRWFYQQGCKGRPEQGCSWHQCRGRPIQGCFYQESFTGRPEQGSETGLNKDAPTNKAAEASLNKEVASTSAVEALCTMWRWWQHSDNTRKIHTVCRNEVYQRCSCSQARSGENNSFLILRLHQLHAFILKSGGFTGAERLALYYFYFSYPFSRGSTILIVHSREEAVFYWIYLGGSGWSFFFIYVQNYA